MNPTDGKSGACTCTCTWARRTLRRLAAASQRRRAGVAAVEFALVLPVLLLFFFATTELEQAVIVNQLVSQTGSTITNIVSQYTSISASTQLPDIFSAASQILAPYPASPAQIVVSCISIDDDGDARVAWSEASNATALQQGQVVTVPTSLDVPNTSVILGQVDYAFEPTLDFLKLGPFHLQSSVYMLPRNSSTISLVP